MSLMKVNDVILRLKESPPFYDIICIDIDVTTGAHQRERTTDLERIVMRSNQQASDLFINDGRVKYKNGLLIIMQTISYEDTVRYNLLPKHLKVIYPPRIRKTKSLEVIKG